MQYRTRFSPHSRLTLNCTLEERRTKSEFLDDCDINKIVARYRKTGQLPESARSAARRFGDFSQVPTFAEMQAKIIAANDLFGALPSHVRKQFDNDPQQFLAAADTTEGRQLLVKLGLGEPVKSKETPEDALGAVPSRRPAGQAGSGGTEPPQAPKGAKKPAKPSDLDE